MSRPDLQVNDGQASFNPSDFKSFLQRFRLKETQCLYNAESESGLWAVLTGPWRKLDWPEPFSSPLYQEQVLFVFEKDGGEYRLSQLQAGALDCCGLYYDGVRVEGAFIHPSNPMVRYYIDVKSCSE